MTSTKTTLPAERRKGLDADQLLTPQDAALFLAVQADTLAHWRTRGNGPTFRKIGRAVRYRRGDLIAFSDARTFSNTVEARHYSPEAV